MKFNGYADRDMAIMNIAHAITSDLRRYLLRHDSILFAVPGGSTPGPVFDAMTSVDIDWDRVRVILTDERWVPEGHERSNAGLVRARLLQGHAERATFVPFFREGLSAEDAAKAMSEDLARELPISVLMLGMGTDMHTASLFPGAPGLEAAMARDASVLCAVAPPGQPEARITFSAPALSGAMDKHLVIFGEDKKAAIERAQTLSALEAPVGAVMKEGTVHWAA
jgi:6-phosphogluconolactonase